MHVSNYEMDFIALVEAISGCGYRNLSATENSWLVLSAENDRAHLRFI